MANIDKSKIGYNEIESAGTANALMVQYKRGKAAPMDISEVFTSLNSAQQYAKGEPIAYAGQTIAVAGEDIKTEVYKITSGSTLVRLVDENDIKNLSGGTNNITVATPDWDAQEGEDGYIKNKPSLTNYATKNEVPISLGGINNSAVLKDGDNSAGLKGFYVNAISGNSIYISESNTEISENIPSIDQQFENPYSVGDVYSLQLGDIYYNLGSISYIDHNLMTVSNLKPIKYDERLRYYFYVVSKPFLGVIDLGLYTTAIGFENSSNDFCAHSQGWNNKSIGKYSHTEGKQNEAYYCAHAEGSNNKSIGNTSHTEGTDNIALNSNAHAEGRYTTASGYASHAEGYGENINNRTVASGDGSHAEGRYTTASGKWSHAEGEKTKSIGLASHAEGLQTVAEGQASHAEGRYTYAKGVQSHAEGYGQQDGSTGAFGAYSHSEGQYTTAYGNKSHSEGTETKASADSAHAEGLRTTANGMYSHAEGSYTITNNDAEHASGQYNVSIPKTADNTTAEATQFSIGIGSKEIGRKNAVEVKQNGDVYITGIGGFDGVNYDNAKSVQETIKELTETVKKLNDIITQITITE